MLLIFLHMKMPWFLLHFWKTSWRKEDPGLAVLFFFCCLKKGCATSFWPPWFVMRNWPFQTAFPLQPGYFQNFIFSFRKFIVICLRADFLTFIFFGIIIQLLIYVGLYFLPNLELFSNIFFQLFFLVLPSFSSSSRTPIMSILDLLL